MTAPLWVRPWLSAPSLFPPSVSPPHCPPRRCPWSVSPHGVPARCPPRCPAPVSAPAPAPSPRPAPPRPRGSVRLHPGRGCPPGPDPQVPSSPAAAGASARLPPFSRPGGTLTTGPRSAPAGATLSTCCGGTVPPRCPRSSLPWPLSLLPLGLWGAQLPFRGLPRVSLRPHQRCLPWCPSLALTCRGRLPHPQPAAWGPVGVVHPLVNACSEPAAVTPAPALLTPQRSLLSLQPCPLSLCPPALSLRPSQPAVTCSCGLPDTQLLPLPHIPCFLVPPAFGPSRPGGPRMPWPGLVVELLQEPR